MKRACHDPYSRHRSPAVSLSKLHDPAAMKAFSGLVLTLWCLAMTGCRTPDSNPNAPQAGTGYVDFYTDISLELSWEIKRADEGTAQWQTVFSEYKPVPGTVLRLASPPGIYDFQVRIDNRVTDGPQSVRAVVEVAKVTPVHVSLRRVDSAYVQNKDYGFRPSAKGYGRGTKVTSQLNEVLQIVAHAEPAQPYQRKEQMPYFHASVD